MEWECNEWQQKKQWNIGGNNRDGVWVPQHSSSSEITLLKHAWTKTHSGSAGSQTAFHLHWHAKFQFPCHVTHVRWKINYVLPIWILAQQSTHALLGNRIGGVACQVLLQLRIQTSLLRTHQITNLCFCWRRGTSSFWATMKIKDGYQLMRSKNWTVIYHLTGFTWKSLQQERPLQDVVFSELPLQRNRKMVRDDGM